MVRFEDTAVHCSAASRGVGGQSAFRISESSPLLTIQKAVHPLYEISQKSPDEDIESAGSTAISEFKIPPARPACHLPNRAHCHSEGEISA